MNVGITTTLIWSMHHGSVQHHQLSAKTSSLKHRSWPQGALDRRAIGPKWRSANVAGRSMTRWFALTEPLSPPWDMSFESASLNIWSRLWFWMVGQSSKHFAKTTEGNQHAKIFLFARLPVTIQRTNAWVAKAFCDHLVSQWCSFLFRAWNHFSHSFEIA